MRTQRWYTYRHLNKLVEVAGNQHIIGDTAEVPAHRVLDHFVVSCNDERRIAQEKKQPNGLKRGDRCFGQTAIQIVDQHNQRHAQVVQDGLEIIP
ncbi:hypothetical protein D3C80_1845510 [compost metagenome]